MPANSGIHDFTLRGLPVGDRPTVFQHRAGLKPVKDAARRLRRWPAAILDRFSPRAILKTAGTEKRPFQPNRETAQKVHLMNWQMLVASLILTLASTVRCASQPVLAEPKADPSISQLVPLQLHSGANDVTFWGAYPAPGANVPFHTSGKIYEFESWAVANTYYATMQWETPSYVLPLEDEIPREGEDSQGAAYFGNMDQPNNEQATPRAMRQYVDFFQGLFNGQKQTFFVIAFSNDGYEAQHININVYAFSGGSEPPDWMNPPGFEPLDHFTTKYKYCDAAYAMLVSLPIVPPPLTELHNRRTGAKQSMKSQSCR